MNRRNAFTLIELLITVSIISILASIAIVNLSLAGTRGKVARAKSDMKTIANSLEAYRVDYAACPPSAIGDIQLNAPLNALTTPRAYITKVPDSAFGPAYFDFNPNMWMSGYNYKDRATTSVNMPAETYGYIWKALPYKEYMIHSCGPNRVWDVTPYHEYDPTNGVNSSGDICIFGPM